MFHFCFWLFQESGRRHSTVFILFVVDATGHFYFDIGLKIRGYTSWILLSNTTLLLDDFSLYKLCQVSSCS